MIVYFASFDKTNAIQPPINIIQNIKNNSSIVESGVLSCPAFIEYYKNVFAIYPSYDYEIEFVDDIIRSKLYNQKFFDNVLILRNESAGIISYMDPHIIFFTENDTLEIETLPPVMHKMLDATYILGTYDIGKHFRPIEMPLILNKKSKHNFYRDNPLYYLKFRTNQKIHFKRFQITDQMLDMLHSIIALRNYNKKLKLLSHFYEITKNYNFKKKYIQLIKQNLYD